MTIPPHDGPFVIVLNPGSGHVDAEATRTAIAGVFDPVGRAFEIVPIEDHARIAKTAQQAVARARELGGVVVALGGDGTLNAVAQAARTQLSEIERLPQQLLAQAFGQHGESP